MAQRCSRDVKIFSSTMMSSHKKGFIVPKRALSRWPRMALAESPPTSSTTSSRTFSTNERKPLCLGVESLSKIDPQCTGTMNFQLLLQMVRLGRVGALELLRIQAGADDNCVDFDIHAHFAVAPSRAQSSGQGKPQPPPRSAPGAAGSEGATTGSSSTAKPPPHQPSSVITAPSQRTNQEDEGICTTSDAGQGSLQGQNV